MSYNKEEWIKKQEEKKDSMKAIMDEFIPTLVVSPDEIEKYLGRIVGLYNYSLYNQIIASHQFWLQKEVEPEIFQTYNRWKKAQRFVKKGETGVAMVRPVKYEYTVENEDGEEETREGMTFKMFTVFDISQTDGEPLQRENLIKGVSYVSYEQIKALAEKSYKIIASHRELERGATNGEWIRISEKMSENYKISTMVHEMAHNKLGHLTDNRKETPIAELEAESVAYMVTTMLGLENEKSRLYICNWNGNDARDAVRERSRLLIKVAEEIYKEIMEIE